MRSLRHVTSPLHMVNVFQQQETISTYQRLKKPRNALFRSSLKVSITLRGRLNIWPLDPVLCPAPPSHRLFYLRFYGCAALRARDLFLWWRKRSRSIRSARRRCCSALSSSSVSPVRSGLLSEPGHSEVVAGFILKGKSRRKEMNALHFWGWIIFKWIRL